MTTDKSTQIGRLKPTMAMASLAASLCLCSAFADTTYVDVTTAGKLTVQTADVVLRPAAADGETDPATLAAPAFWFDAGATNGWTIAADGAVELIASKVGLRRLVVGGPSGWSGWSNGSALAPTYVPADAVTGLPCVDFGAGGSGCAMTFDGDALGGVGTVIMVRDTSAGGGWIFTGTTESPFTWKRGGSAVSADPHDPRFTLAYASGGEEDEEAHELVRTALMRQDGAPYIATSVGWAGRWETFAFNPKEATLTASGLGINDIGSSDVGVSGGFKIAELLVYDRVLTLAEIAGVERFLKRKWLGKMRPVAGADARIGLLYANQTTKDGLTVGVDVGEDRQFLVKDIRAGHDGNVSGAARVVKTGAGSLRLGDLSRYNGKVELNGGDVDLDYAEAPDYPSNIAARAVYHFDVSAAAMRDDYVENGTNFVRSLTDVDGHAPVGASAAFTLNSQGITGGHDRRVYLTEDWSTPTGLPTLDFGRCQEWGTYYSHGMSFSPQQSCQLTTVIALVGTQRGGGWIMNVGFQRTTTLPSYSTGLLTGKLADSTAHLCEDPVLMPTNGVAYVDGKRVSDPRTTGYPDNTGFHVLALQIPGTKPSSVGGYWDRVGGGLILGELLAWANPLSEREILETSEYLARKWLGRSLSDLADDETLPRGDGVADVQKLSVGAASSITVSGESARIGTLTVNAPLLKKGAGTLYVEELVANARIAIEDGDIRTVSRPELDSTGIAAAPSLRLDMADTNGWTFASHDERTVVAEAPLGGTAGVVLKPNGGASTSPWVDAELGPASRPGTAVLNFGTYGDVSGDPGYAGAKCLTFDRNLESVRSVFQVWRLPQGSGAMLLGSSHADVNADGGTGTHLNAYRMDFHRGFGPGYVAGSQTEHSCTNGPFYHGNNASGAALNGTVLQNGTKVSSPAATQPTYGEWVVVEAHTAAGAHASGIACDRNVMKRGGMALAELIIYERALTEREKVSTRNYLLRKWLGKTDGELQPVPEPEAAPTLSYETLEVLPGSPEELGETGAAAVSHLTGSGVFSKVGAGTVTLGDAKDFTGDLRVVSGTLKLLSAYRGEPAMAGLDRGLRFRLAADEITPEMCEANTDGTTGVKTWPNSLGDGWKAEAQERDYAITTGVKLSGNIPVLEPASLNGKATVRMPQKTCFQFKNPSGEYSTVSRICSALWVIGSQEGGGFVLGGGSLSSSDSARKYYTWHRGNRTGTGTPGMDPDDYIVCSSGDAAAFSIGAWWKNGASVNGNTTGLSGGWDVLGYRNNRMDLLYYAGASGLAFDGRVFAGQNYSQTVGNQRLAEVLLYTNQLTEAEILATSIYLDIKWGLNHTLASPEQDFDLWVSAGATVELAGYNGFRSVGGSGAVQGSFVSETFVADAEETGLQVDGTVTIPGDPVVSFRNLPESKCAITVATATDFAGAENLDNVTFAGLPANWVARVQIKNGSIVAYARPKQGLMIIAR